MNNIESKFDFKNTPLSTEKPVFKFPEFEVVKVNNSVSVYLYKDSSQALVNFRLSFHKGAYHESIPGLGLLTAALLLKGTGALSAKEISEKFDLLGASVSITARWDDTFCNLNVLHDKLEPALAILSDCVFNPAFSEEEIQRHKKKQIATILQEHANSSYLAQVAFNSVFYRDLPYSHLRLGTAESIGEITREDCLNQHHTLLNNSPASVIVAGNFDRDQVLNYISTYFKDLKGTTPTTLKNDIPDSVENSIVLIEKPKAFQTTLVIGKKTLQKNSPDYFHMQLINCIFGGNFLSRLNSLLREEKGFTYGINSSIASRKFASSFMISTNINKESTAESINDIINEMKKISSEKVEKAEAELCIQYILGTFIRSIESPQQINALLQGISLFGLDHEFYDNYFKMISGLDSESIFNSQEKYMKPEGLVIAASGDLEYLQKELTEYGDISICDKEGNIQKL